MQLTNSSFERYSISKSSPKVYSSSVSLVYRILKYGISPPISKSSTDIEIPSISERISVIIRLDVTAS